MSATLVFVLTIITLIQADHRKVEIDRIKTYELVHFDIDTQNDILEFNAFNNHYKIELEENIDMTPSNITHTNGIPEHIDIEPYYTSLTKSCHYYGKVLSDTTDPLQRVSLSLCTKRGIRGEIRAFNETIIIKPSRYYLDREYDNNNFHSITDEHLIWKYSDFDRSGIPHFGSININIKSIITTLKNKRRLIYNGGSNKLELLILSDYSQTKYYIDTYGNTWYQQLSADMADNVNAISSRYMAQSVRNELSASRWNIGDISVHFKEFEVMVEYFPGKYASMNPGCLNYDNCNTGWDHCDCTISGTTYLSAFTEYIQNYKDQSTFDNAQLITKYYFENAAGWGWIGVICKTQNNAATMVANYGLTNTVVGQAHEMGHNFGAQHDGEGNECDSGEGMMGGAQEGFSYCSFRYFSEYFRNNNGLTCLNNNPRDFISSYNDGSNGGGTDPSNNGGNNGGNTGGGSDSCIGITSLETSYSIDFNGYWQYNSNGYYTKDGYYLHFYSGYNLWIIGSDLNGGVWAYCTEQDINNCGVGTWYYGDYEMDWTVDTNAYIYSCSDTGNGGSGNGCSYYNCVGLWDMSVSWDGTDLNKYYRPFGCRNGAGKYRSDDGILLYKTSSGWTVYNEESDDDAYVYCHTDNTDPTTCANKMMYYDSVNSQWNEDNSVYVYDCSNNALNIGSDCENIELYNNALCVKNSNALEYNETEWILLGDMCENDMPVYYFENNDKNITYYLHFEEQKKYVNSNETIAKWIITMDDITATEYAYCEQKDLLNCIEKEWYSEVGVDNDALGFYNDKDMIVLNTECNVMSNANNKSMNVEVITIVILVIGVLVLGGIVGFCVYRTFAKKIKQGKKVKSQMEEVADVEEEAENEIEVEVNTNEITNEML